ncbi:MAG: GNAT family N-acetyltransferase [Pyrinomonadaceae bacterium]
MKNASELKIRLATPEDSASIAVVLFEAFSAFREHYTPEAFEVVTPSAEVIAGRFDEGPIWVAEIEGRVVGTVSLTTEPEGLYIRSMAVQPAAQGFGIGHKLLDALNDHVSTSEIERMFLYTTYFVPGAKELYEKHGFKRVRDTTADEWYGTAGLEMDKYLEGRSKQDAIGS